MIDAALRLDLPASAYAILSSLGKKGLGFMGVDVID